MILTTSFLPFFFGNTVIRQISTKPFTVYRVETRYKPVVKNMRWGRGRLDWNEILRSLAENRQRNDDIVNLCLSLTEGRIIVGTKRKNQARYIHKQLLAKGENVALLIENDKSFPNCKILIGIYAKMGKGMDTRNLCEDWEGDVFNIAILALDLGDPEQFVGRVFRHNNPVIYDLVDDFSSLRTHFDGDSSRSKKGRKDWYLARNGVIERILL